MKVAETTLLEGIHTVVYILEFGEKNKQWHSKRRGQTYFLVLETAEVGHVSGSW